MGKRITNALDHFKGAYLRAKPAGWTRALLSAEEVGEEEKEKEEEKQGMEPAEAAIVVDSDDANATTLDDGEPEAPTSFYYGWSCKLEKAWRVPVGNPDEHARQYAVDHAPGAHGLDPIVATFDDGETRQIPQCLTATLKAMSESTSLNAKAKSSRDSIVYWRGNMTDGSPVIVKRRLDGANSDGEPRVLTSLFIGQKQRCMCARNSVVSDDVSISIMTKLAKDLCEGTLKDSDLFAARDAALSALGISQPRKSMKQKLLQPSNGHDDLK